MLPQGKQAGGAPMNVAFHLNRLGLNAFPFTAVGRDLLGQELVRFLAGKKISTRMVQENDFPTGKVLVKLNEKNEASYTIESPSAWDYIQVGDEDKRFLQTEAPIVVYGSLASRNFTSHQSLKVILSYANLRICDINLRAPFYNPEIVFELMASADWVKINNEELDLIAQWFEVKPEEEADQALMLMNRFPQIEKLLVTRGDRGAVYYDREGSGHMHPGFKVKVADTVGSGDSFLAMFIAQYLNGSPVEECLEKACAMGAVVAKHQGATALFDIEKEIKQLVQETG